MIDGGSMFVRAIIINNYYKFRGIKQNRVFECAQAERKREAILSDSREKVARVRRPKLIISKKMREIKMSKQFKSIRNVSEMREIVRERTREQRNFLDNALVTFIHYILYKDNDHTYVHTYTDTYACARLQARGS